MTDGPLMDADCIHGNPWYDCPSCDPRDGVRVPLTAEVIAEGRRLRGIVASGEEVSNADWGAWEVFLVDHGPALLDAADGVRVPPDPAQTLVDIIAEALNEADLIGDHRSRHDQKVAIIAAALVEHREAAVRAVGMEQYGWMDKFKRVHQQDVHSDPRMPVYRWAEPPRQPAPSTESGE